MQDACGAAGLDARSVTVADAVRARLDRAPDEPPPARLLRLPSGTPQAELDALLATREAERRLAGVWLDEPADVARAHDKPVALARLAAAGLPVPASLLVLDGGEPDADALPGDTLVVKPARGTSGRGVAIGLPRREALRRARAFAELTGPVLVQEQLGDGTDRRLFLVDGELVAAMERRPRGGDGRGNAARGALVQAWEPDADALALGRAAAERLGLAIAGVDLIDGPRGPCVLEVNAAPGLSAIEAATGRDVAGALAAALRRRLESR